MFVCETEFSQKDIRNPCAFYPDIQWEKNKILIEGVVRILLRADFETAVKNYVFFDLWVMFPDS